MTYDFPGAEDDSGKPKGLWERFLDWLDQVTFDWAARSMARREGISVTNAKEALRREYEKDAHQ